MESRFRRIAIGIFIVLMGSGVLPACSKSPTAPGFPYSGIWNGYWKDYLGTDTGVPFGSAIALNVGDDGIGFASGEYVYTYSNGTLTDRLTMNFTVYPDGSVVGTGEWRFTFPGLGASADGEVLGQLDARLNTGSGALHAEVNGVMVHFPWKVEREK